MLFWVISFLFITIYASLIAFYRAGWKKAILLQGKSVVLKSRPTISVIVPARNESRFIRACIEGILAQEYDLQKMELIVIDDASEDDTFDIVSKFANSDSRVRLISLKQDPQQKANKKRAVEAGIAIATGELIVCTDADCTHPKTWLGVLAASYNNGANKFIAAPVVYETTPDVLSVFQTLDFMTLQGITAASVTQKFHTMCNGANIAYERNVFFEVNGFEGIDRLPTGDDMLLMHKVYKKYPEQIAYMLSKEGLVKTIPPQSWKAFFQQRIRWASKAAFYDDKRIFWVLLLVYLLNLWILLLAVLSPFWKEAFISLGILLVVKTLVECWFIWPIATFFNKTKWMWTFPLLQPLHILYTLVAGWLGRFGQYEWKGRTIRNA